MREYIFRGKRVDNGEWVYGCLVTGFDERKGRESVDIAYQQFEGASMDYPYPTVATFYQEVIPETVGQYTGLKDKNEKMIFEGDILKHQSVGNSMLMGWDDVNYCWHAEVPDSFIQRYAHQNGWDQMEVIGNFHDNPEILK